MKMSDDGPDSTEEEILVYVEFKDNLNIDQYKNIHVLGIDGKQPIVQMDDSFFIGKYENPIGTYMFFEEDPAPHCADLLFDKMPETSVKFKSKTRKYLQMEHAYVTPKEGKEHNLPSHSQQNEDDIEPVNFKTLQDALDKFKNKTNLNEGVDNKINTNNSSN